MNNIKDICDEYDYELYYRLQREIIPYILEEAYDEGFMFYVKGGRAVDAYLETPIGSPDWDVISNDYNGLSNFIFKRLKSMPFIANMVRKDRVDAMGDKGFQIGLNICDDFYLVDVVEGDVKQQYITDIFGIPYLRKDLLIKNLNQTIIDRQNRLHNLEQTENAGKAIQLFEQRLNTNKAIIEDADEKIRKQFKNLNNLFKKLDVEQEAKPQLLKIFNLYKDIYDNQSQLVKWRSPEFYKEIVASQDKYELLKKKLERTIKRRDALKKI